ncbi:MAG: extracellular solute-binding protein, partial [Pseudomonadota bacterium]
MNIRRLFSSTAVVGVSVAAALSATTALAQDKVVNVYNWSDYIDEEILTDFEAETGIKVQYDVFDSNEVLETKMLAGGTGYDIVVPTGSFLSRQIQAGAFAPLDKSKLPNLKNMWNVVSDRTEKYDPGGQYSINYMWGTTGIGYNVEKVADALGADAPVDSLSLVFEPANMERLQSCGVHFLDAPTELIPAALNYIGEDPDSKDPEVIAKAEAVLQAVR